MNKNNLVHLLFFAITLSLLTFIAVKQVIVNSDYTPLSYKRLLNPKNFIKAFSSIKNNKEYKVNLSEVENYQADLNKQINNIDTGYQHNQFINFSTDGETAYIASTNDKKSWDILFIDNLTSEVIFSIKNIKHPGEQLVNSYQPLFEKIAFPHQTNDGYMITLFDLKNREVLGEYSTIMSHGVDTTAKEMDQFFYDETTNFVGYKSGQPNDIKFYTLDLNQLSLTDSLVQMVFLESAGKDFEFLYYYPGTKMMLFKSTKKPNSTTNHPQEEYFLYSLNKPTLVILDQSNFK